MKIVIDENMPYARELFAPFGEICPQPGRQMTAASVADADVLLVRSVTRVDAALLAQNERLQFVGTATIGTDHVDQQLLARRQVAFHSAPGCNRISVADYVLSSLLAVTQQQGDTLHGKRVGIIGAGNTGSAVGSHLSALGCEILWCDPPLEQQGDPRTFVSLEQALQADIVSLHVPLTRTGEHATWHLLGEAQLARLEEGQILVNACRGEVIDNQALLRLKRGGWPVTLVLDVWEGEPDVELALLPFVALATPHIAGYSLEGKARGTQMLLDAFCHHLGRAAPLDVWSLLPEPVFVAVQLGEQPDLAHLTQLVHLVYDVRRDDGTFRRTIGAPGQFDLLRKHYPERRELSSLRLSGAFGEQRGTLQQLGFTLTH